MLCYRLSYPRTHFFKDIEISHYFIKIYPGILAGFGFFPQLFDEFFYIAIAAFIIIEFNIKHFRSSSEMMITKILTAVNNKYVIDCLEINK